MNGGTPPGVLYRTTERHYADLFVEQGEIYFRPLTIYRAIEGSKQDEYEGSILAKPSRTIVELWDEVTRSYVAPLETSKATIVRSLCFPDEYYVTCFSHVSLVQHGSTTIEIFNAQEFASKLRISLSEQLGVELVFGDIVYYDPLQYIPEPHDAQAIAFFKRTIFRDEREYRLMFHLNSAARRSILRSGRKTNPKFEESLAHGLKIRVGSLKRFARVI